MNLLALGDITDQRAAAYVAERLWEVRRREHIDFVVANGENASFIIGAGPDQVRKLTEGGVDVITGGNHTMQNPACYPMLEEGRLMVRPLNYPDAVPGHGYVIADACGYRLLVMNVMGVMSMQPQLDHPVPCIRRVLEREAGKYDAAVLDIHAELTGEKYLLAHLFDGEIQVMFGTHTHVPTADERVLPRGSGYITDIGMCGVRESVLGCRVQEAQEAYLTRIHQRHVPAEGPIQAEGAIFTFAPGGRVEQVRRLVF